MFKFDFEIEDQDEALTIGIPEPSRSAPSADSTVSKPSRPCHSITLDQVIATLPDSISYSPLAHPTGGEPLLRRDLFDARFQLAQGEDEWIQAGPSGSVDKIEDGQRSAGAYVDAETDLIPGTYEGGLKSWEGGLDLIEVIARVVGTNDEQIKEDKLVANWVRGSKVLEVGCGTGLPSAYLLRSLLSESTPVSHDRKTILHLQDYNLPVLSLVTLPNLILAALSSLPPTALADADVATEIEAVAPDTTIAGTLDLTPKLLRAFTELLNEHNIELLFTYGDWSGLAEELVTSNGSYNLVLTAETIYAEDSVDSLLSVLRAATGKIEHRGHEHVDIQLERSLEALSVRESWGRGALMTCDPVVLVAAKVLYFGVGGGIESFVRRIVTSGGWSANVRDWIRGVGRRVVRVGW